MEFILFTVDSILVQFTHICGHVVENEEIIKIKKNVFNALEEIFHYEVPEDPIVALLGLCPKTFDIKLKYIYYKFYLLQ